MSPVPLGHRLRMPSLLNQRPSYLSTMNKLTNALPFRYTVRNDTVRDWERAFELPPPAPMPAYAKGLYVCMVETVAAEGDEGSTEVPRVFPLYVLHTDGQLNGGITSTILQPTHADVTHAYEGDSNSAAARQPYCFEIRDVTHPTLRRTSPSVAHIQHSLLRFGLHTTVSVPTTVGQHVVDLETFNILQRFERRLVEEYGEPRIWALGPNTMNVMAYVTNAVELTGPNYAKPYLQLETVCADLFAEYDPEWRVYNHTTAEYEYSAEGVYHLVNGFLNPPTAKYARTLYGANKDYFHSETSIMGIFQGLHPFKFQHFWTNALKISSDYTFCLKITEKPPQRIPYTDTTLYPPHTRYAICQLWAKVHELYRAVHLHERYANLFGSSVLWIRAPVYGQFEALYALLHTIDSLFVEGYSGTTVDERAKKSPFSTNNIFKTDPPLSAVQQIIVNQFAPLAIGEREDSFVSGRFRWHFPAARALFIACVQGAITLHIPGFPTVHLTAPEAVVLPGKLWHYATSSEPTLPQTLTIVY